MSAVSAATATIQLDTTRPAGHIDPKIYVPYLDVAATLSEDRVTLHLSVINRHRSEAMTAKLVVDGLTTHLPPRAHVHAIAHDVEDVLTSNSSGHPDRVALRDLGSVELPEGRYEFPPHSPCLLSLTLS